MPLTEPAGPYRLFKVNTFTRRVFVAGQNNQCAGQDCNDWKLADSADSLDEDAPLISSRSAQVDVLTKHQGLQTLARQETGADNFAGCCEATGRPTPALSSSAMSR